MYNRSGFNQPGRSYVQDNATPISDLFDLKQDKPKSYHGYNNIFEGTCSNSYPERQEPFKESQTYQHRTPDREEDVFLPSLNRDSKLSPAWTFLKQFNSTDVEGVYPSKKSISDLFDLPKDNKFQTGLGNRGGNECSLGAEGRSPNHHVFLKREFEFHDHQTESLEDFIPENIQSSLHSSWYKNESLNQDRVNKIQPSSLISNKVNKSRRYRKPKMYGQKTIIHQNRRRRRKLKNNNTF